ncbi:translation initiation factor IF-2 N-terminal domain-containing protein [Pseudolactococcus reticulitermitis]|uniref:Translation initiation factor IF-2 N-terminal domain-containing protein n=1 Tax=Pseudolactococcus reticulitermitis TaxID=2025039 RepID=A0A224WX92_9LACT|nr:translation initiation factor IF-2 N-terminal domain-containing protein [Lactococcus reticulitermitis]GAX46857.1 hypothetical protein RsY01_437 [Lactococcus reticulitermitis]
MSKTRIYEVARNLDRTSKEILAISNILGFEAKAANSSLDQAQISAIENYLIPPEPKKKKSRKKVNQFENVSDVLASESSCQRQSENYDGMTKKEVKRYQKTQRKLEKQSKTRQKVEKKRLNYPNNAVNVRQI